MPCPRHSRMLVMLVSIRLAAPPPPPNSKSIPVYDPFETAPIKQLSGLPMNDSKNDGQKILCRGNPRPASVTTTQISFVSPRARVYRVETPTVTETEKRRRALRIVERPKTCIVPVDHRASQPLAEISSPVDRPTVSSRKGLSYMQPQLQLQDINTTVTATKAPVTTHPPLPSRDTQPRS